MSTGIDYLDETWNPVTGCSGKGCKAHCWAREMVMRFPHIHGIHHQGKDYPGFPFEVPIFHPDRLDKPLHWKKPRRIGVCFMGDLFDIDTRADWIHAVIHRTEMAKQHSYFFLTKQPEKMGNVIRNHWTTDGTRLANCWFGVSITDQEDADRMIPELLRVPGKRWVSVEPMLGPVSFVQDRSYPPPLDMFHISWVVLGCESGPKRRPCPQEWMIDVVRQCKAAGVPVWVKQVEVQKVILKSLSIGTKVSHYPEEWPEELRTRERP